VEPKCGNYNSSIEDCIHQKTFTQTEAFKDVILGFTTKQSLLELDNIWTEDFTNSWSGRTYTLNIPKKIGPDDAKDQLFIAVRYNLNYKLVLHDPFYFAVNSNPRGFPSVTLVVNPNETGSHYYRLELTEVEELNLPEDPCNPDRDYNFHACIKETISSRAGCRTGWDRWSQQGRPLCTQMDQYR
jgi:hypothetical protein